MRRKGRNVSVLFGAVSSHVALRQLLLVLTTTLVASTVEQVQPDSVAPDGVGGIATDIRALARDESGILRQDVSAQAKERARAAADAMVTVTGNNPLFTVRRGMIPFKRPFKITGMTESLIKGSSFVVVLAVSPVVERDLDLAKGPSWSSEAGTATASKCGDASADGNNADADGSSGVHGPESTDGGGGGGGGGGKQMVGDRILQTQGSAMHGAKLDPPPRPPPPTPLSTSALILMTRWRGSRSEVADEWVSFSFLLGPLGMCLRGIAISSDNSTAYVADACSRSILAVSLSLIDQTPPYAKLSSSSSVIPASVSIVASSPILERPVDIAFDGKLHVLYVTTLRGLVAVDIGTGRSKVVIPSCASGCSLGLQLGRLALSSSGGWGFLVDASHDRVVRFDLIGAWESDEDGSAAEMVTTFKSGLCPLALAVSGDNGVLAVWHDRGSHRGLFVYILRDEEAKGDSEKDGVAEPRVERRTEFASPPSSSFVSAPGSLATPVKFSKLSLLSFFDAKAAGGGLSDRPTSRVIAMSLGCNGTRVLMVTDAAELLEALAGEGRSNVGTSEHRPGVLSDDETSGKPGDAFSVHNIRGNPLSSVADASSLGSPSLPLPASSIINDRYNTPNTSVGLMRTIAVCSVISVVLFTTVIWCLCDWIGGKREKSMQESSSLLEEDEDEEAVGEAAEGSALHHGSGSSRGPRKQKSSKAAAACSESGGEEVVIRGWKIPPGTLMRSKVDGKWTLMWPAPVPIR